MADLIDSLVSYVRVILICQLLQTSACSECQGTDVHGYLNGRNIESFLGCTEVMGSLVMNRTSLEGNLHTAPVRHSQLAYLSSIKEINDYLLIEDIPDSNFTSLRFLRNLEIIHGGVTFEYRSGQEYSLIVQNVDYLQTMSLSSLQRIENGGIRISSNPLLCLVDTLAVEEILVSSTLKRIGGLGMDCSAYTCHDQCAQSKGCWGTLADECMECRNYKYLGTCVESCDMTVSYANHTSRECLIQAPVTTVQRTTPTSSAGGSLSRATPAVTHHNDHNVPVSPPENIPTTLSENATVSASDSLEDQLTIWSTGAVPLGVVGILTSVGVLVCCVYHRWKKTQKRNLAKGNHKESELTENTCTVDMISRDKSFPNDSDRLSYPTKDRVSISELTAQSYHPSHHTITNRHVLHYKNDEIDGSGVQKSCDSPPDHVTLKCVNEAPHFNSSNSVGTHRNICIEFQNNSLHQSDDCDLSSRTDTTPLLSTKQTLYTSRKSSENMSSSSFTPKEGHFTTQVHRPMTGGVYSTRTSPSLYTTSLRPSLTSSHGTRTPSRLPPSHRESLTSSHGGSISRASTRTSRTSNSRSTGSSARMVVSVHGSDPSFGSGELVENG